MIKDPKQIAYEQSEEYKKSSDNITKILEEKLQERIEKIKAEKLIKLLNDAWDCLPEKPFYGMFNNTFPAKGFVPYIDPKDPSVCGIEVNNIEKLRQLEKENPILGLARYGTKDEGLSIVSIIATITDYFLPGYRFAVVLETPENKEFNNMEEYDKLELRKIIGFDLIKTEK